MSAPNFFTQGSPYLHHPALTPERTAAEIDFVLSQAQVPPGSRILDVGCGPGRHSLELARRGYRVVGIDPAAAMIAAARERAQDLETPPEFIQARAQDFSADETFDAAICLFTTLGQMDERGDNRGLLERVAQTLAPGGTLVVETPQRGWVAQNLKAFDRFEDDERVTIIDRSLDEGENIVSEIFTLISGQERHTYLLRYRVFSQEEMRTLLEESGLEVVTTFGSYESAPLQADSPVMLFVARVP